MQGSILILQLTIAGDSDTLKLLNTLLSSVGSFTFNEAFVQSTQYDQLIRSIQGNQLLPQSIVKAGQLLLLLSMLCHSRKQQCQLHAAPLFSALSACDRFLLASPDCVPADVAPLLNLLRDCGLCCPSLTVYKSHVIIPSNAVVCLLLTLFVTMHKLNSSRHDGFCRHSFIAGLFCLLNQVNAVKEFGKTAGRFVDSLSLIKDNRDKQLFLSYCSGVTTFSL
ncbi:hypothetical protein KIN20_037362 [Parelaphostrongylus tenuis]|uniref:Uncharacterized protein n=1 Tax=Parelaphostrongylus tenuis TaxID=148309 RepID=A0AAD5WLZ5_PARTN|nr:hypothetical protein KIN20_037362 [Parelaphostrongylus tenuis]